jgi:hypothetical protein
MFFSVLLSALFVFAPPPSEPRLIFSKSFPGSVPAFYRITVPQNGAAKYETAPEDPNPRTFPVSAGFTKRAFELADKLNHFRGESLETKKKIASMGMKTVIYENGAERGEASFNYSENTDAMALAEMFEKVSNTRQYMMTLERLLRYDKLGIMKQLLQTETALDHHDLLEAAQLKPVLEEISGSRGLMNIAQQRARIILGKIQDSAK